MAEDFSNLAVAEDFSDQAESAVPDFSSEAELPAPKLPVEDRTYLSRLYPVIHQIIRETGTRFYKAGDIQDSDTTLDEFLQQPKLTEEEAAKLNTITMSAIKKMADERLNESGLSKFGRGARDALFEVVEGIQTPQAAALIAGTVASGLLGPEIPFLVAASLATKQAAQSTGVLLTPGQTTEEYVKQAALGASATLLPKVASRASAIPLTQGEMAKTIKGLADDEKALATIQTPPEPALTKVEKAGILRQLEEEVPAAAPLEQPATVPVSEIPTSASSVSSFVLRNFTKEKGLPEEAYAAWRERMGTVNEQAVAASHASRDLTAALARSTGSSEWMARLAGLRNVGPELVKQMDDALKGGDINTLPEQLREPVSNMRAHVDALSSRMVSEGLVEGELAAAIDSNMGAYLTRSYRVFEDPKWVFDNVPVDIRNNAKRFVREEMGFDDARAESFLRDLFSDWKQNGVAQLFQPKRLGSKDLSITMKRKDIAPEFRALMGEYKDPFVNYLRSVSKMSRFIADQTFLNTIKEKGMGKWLFEEGNNPAGFNTRIAAEGSEVMSPLNGLRTSEHLARVFNEFGKTSHIENPALRFFLGVNAASKMSKTVYSVMTQARNLTSQMYFWLFNGHYSPEGFKKLVPTVLTDLGLMKDAQFRAYGQKLARLGISGESAFTGELRESLADFSRKLSDQNVSPLDYGAGKVAQNLAIKAPQRSYHTSDVAGKIVGFEAELARVKRDYPNLPEPQAEFLASERVRNTYPTYSNIPEWVRLTRRVPLIGPFMPFAYESLRTMGHGLNYLRQDIQEGHVRSATERGVGMLLAVGAANFGVQALSRVVTGLTAKDDRDLRSQLPSWEKNSALLYTGKGDGKIDFINLSYANPYSYAVDPLLAVLSSDQNEEKFLETFWNAAGEFLRPWTSEQMLIGAIEDVRKNKTQEGREVFNPQASTAVKIEAGLKHVWERALEPGTLTRARKRIIPSAQGSVDAQSGLTSEVLAELSGYRERSHDFGESLTFRAKQFNQALRDSTELFTANLRNPKRTTDAMEQYRQAEEARYNNYTRMARDVQVARRQGLSDAKIRERLRFAGVGTGTIEAILKMRYEPYLPGNEIIAAAKSAGKPLPLKEIKAMFDERRKLVINP